MTIDRLAYEASLNNLEPGHIFGDPAAWDSDFGYALDRTATRLDARLTAELRRHALQHPDPVMREQALYEYVDRREEDAVELLYQAVVQDSDQQLRWNALWAIEKIGGYEAIQALQDFQRDHDPEIAEWATLFLSELETGQPVFDRRAAAYTEGRTFDETIFLLIHCDLYIRLDHANRHWAKLPLAPQGLARIYGQAHACPNIDTREHQLVIAKTIEGLHPEGHLHVDNDLFRGFTERTHPERGNFFFESHVRRPFYLSGITDDASEGTLETHSGFMHQGCWYLDKSIRVRNHAAIRYVRGRFQGWGYTDLQNVIGRSLEEIIVPGNGIVSTLHDPVAGPMTNVFISGTFKGKLNDWDGDGFIDLNSRNVYATVNGEVDSDQDGIPDRPGVACAVVKR